MPLIPLFVLRYLLSHSFFCCNILWCCLSVFVVVMIVNTNLFSWSNNRNENYLIIEKLLPLFYNTSLEGLLNTSLWNYFQRYSTSFHNSLCIPNGLKPQLTLIVSSIQAFFTLMPMSLFSRGKYTLLTVEFYLTDGHFFCFLSALYREYELNDFITTQSISSILVCKQIMNSLLSCHIFATHQKFVHSDTMTCFLLFAKAFPQIQLSMAFHHLLIRLLRLINWASSVGSNHNWDQS